MAACVNNFLTRNIYFTLQVTVFKIDRGEKNFHVFYYLYDGLESVNRLAEFYLDPVLRLHHRYLGEDAQDAATKKVRANR
jgi:myosin-3